MWPYKCQTERHNVFSWPAGMLLLVQPRVWLAFTFAGGSAGCCAACHSPISPTLFHRAPPEAVHPQPMLLDELALFQIQVYTGLREIFVSHFFQIVKGRVCFHMSGWKLQWVRSCLPWSSAVPSQQQPPREGESGQWSTETPYLQNSICVDELAFFACFYKILQGLCTSVSALCTHYPFVKGCQLFPLICCTQLQP